MSFLGSRASKKYIDKNALWYLFVDEKYVELLQTGKYYFYTNPYDVDVKAIDTCIKKLEVLEKMTQ